MYPERSSAEDLQRVGRMHAMLKPQSGVVCALRSSSESTKNATLLWDLFFFRLSYVFAIGLIRMFILVFPLLVRILFS